MNTMKEFKGTKGNWILEKCIIYNPISNHENGDINQIAQCYSGLNIEATKEECEANALLISKSTEMLEMLSRVVDSGLLEEWSIHSDIEQLIKQATEV